MTTREMLREVAYRLDNYAAKLDTDDGPAKFKYAAALRALADRMDQLERDHVPDSYARIILARLDADITPGAK